MMENLTIKKVISNVDSSDITKNELYFVRTGIGFDVFLSDMTGSILYKINTDESAVFRSKLKKIYESSDDVIIDDSLDLCISKLQNQINILKDEKIKDISVKSEKNLENNIDVTLSLTFGKDIKKDITFTIDMPTEKQIESSDILNTKIGSITDIEYSKISEDDSIKESIIKLDNKNIEIEYDKSKNILSLKNGEDTSQVTIQSGNSTGKSTQINSGDNFPDNPENGSIFIGKSNTTIFTYDKPTSQWIPIGNYTPIKKYNLYKTNDILNLNQNNFEIDYTDFLYEKIYSDNVLKVDVRNPLMLIKENKVKKNYVSKYVIGGAGNTKKIKHTKYVSNSSNSIKSTPVEEEYNSPNIPKITNKIGNNESSFAVLTHIPNFSLDSYSEDLNGFTINGENMFDYDTLSISDCLLSVCTIYKCGNNVVLENSSSDSYVEIVFDIYKGKDTVNATPAGLMLASGDYENDISYTYFNRDTYFDGVDFTKSDEIEINQNLINICDAEFDGGVDSYYYTLKDQSKTAVIYNDYKYYITLAPKPKS